MNYNENTLTLLFVLILALLFAVLIAFFRIIKPLSEDRAYIKAEIRRALDVSEYRYWKKEMKKLYISYIPLIGKAIARHIDN